MCDIQFWATVASPIIGVGAIIFALIISSRSSKDAQKQVDEIRTSTKKHINALNKQIDAFKAAQAPVMHAQLEQYQAQLNQIDAKIARAQQEYEVVNPFFGLGGARIDDLTYLEDKKHQAQGLKQLKDQRKKIVDQIQLIESFLKQ